MYSIIKTVSGIPAICRSRGTWDEALDTAVSLVKETHGGDEAFIRNSLETRTYYEWFDCRVDILEIQ